MSHFCAKKQFERGTLRVALVAILACATVLLTPAYIHAEGAIVPSEASSTDVEAPVGYVEPLNSAETPTPVDSPEPTEPSEPTVPSQPAAIGVIFNPTNATNIPTLQWTWAFNAPENEESEGPFELKGYRYEIYRETELVASGTLDPLVVSFEYAAPSDGTYTLYLWAVNDDDSEPYNASNAILLDTLPPSIENGGVVVDGETASAQPQMGGIEPDVQYNWQVEGDLTGASISDPAQLNPLFTFSRDGTYTFVLTARDRVGNMTVISLPVTYLAPFIPGPEEVITIPQEFISGPVLEFTDIKAVASPVRYIAPQPDANPNVELRASVPFDASVQQPVEADDEQLGEVKSSSVATVSTSNQGWVLLGIAWYWWVLLIAGIALSVRWVLVLSRARNSP